MDPRLRDFLWHLYMIKPVRLASLYLLRHSLSSARALGLLYHGPGRNAKRNTHYSIGIVTYIRRYDQFFKPLIQTVQKLFPDTELLVAVNGYYEQAEQKKYLDEISAFLARYPNVKVLPHNDAQSLSRLWNQLIIHSTQDKTLILNDDILLLPSFRLQLENCGILSEDLGLLKKSWSHFMISKKIIAQVGWFDERFPGVGNEDEDYEARLFAAHLPVPSYAITALRNVVFKTKDFSYGKQMEVTNKKYTSDNKRFFELKWEVADEPRPGFVRVPILGKSARLKPGMETPNFYPEISYSDDRI